MFQNFYDMMVEEQMLSINLMKKAINWSCVSCHARRK